MSVHRFVMVVGAVAMLGGLLLPVVTIERMQWPQPRIESILGIEWLGSVFATGVCIVWDTLQARVLGVARDPVIATYGEVDPIGVGWFSLALVSIFVGCMRRVGRHARVVGLAALAIAIATMWIASLCTAGAPCPFVLDPWGESLGDPLPRWRFEPGHWCALVGASLVLLGAIVREVGIAGERARWRLRPWGTPRDARPAASSLPPAVVQIHEQAQRIREELQREPAVTTATAELLWALAHDVVALDRVHVAAIRERGIDPDRLRAELVGAVQTDAVGREPLAEALRCDATLARLLARLATEADGGSPFRGPPRAATR